MKIDMVNVSPCRVKATVKAEAEETHPDYDAVIRYFVQKANVPGFRAGKVPLEVIKRTFSNEIREEVNNRLVRSLFVKVRDQEKLKVVNLVNVEDVRFSPETGMTVTFEIDIEPKVDLPNYKKVPLKFVAPEVTEAEVDSRLQRVREAFAKFDTATADYPVEYDDLVSIDYEGKINGQPLKEVAPEAAAISEGKAHWTLVTSERFLPQLVTELVGMKTGETKTVEFTFEGDYLPDTLKNQPAVYVLTVNEVRRRALPTDEELLQQVRATDMEHFRNRTREGLAESAAEGATRKFESEIITYLLGKQEFDLPQSQLEEEINETLHRMAEDAGRRGLTKDDLERHRAEIVEDATAVAKRQLRTRYLLNAIADEEKVEATDEDISAWIEAAAPDYQVTPIQLRARIEKNGRMDDLRQQVRTRKVLTQVVESLKGL